MKHVAYAFLVCSLNFAAPPPTADPDLKTIEAVQTSWDKTLTFQANFKQTVFSKRLGTTEESKGQLWVKKPGKLKWAEADPATTQILNGKKMWNIHQHKRRKTTIVDIFEDVSKQMDAKAFEFLAGKINFKKSYKTTVVKETAQLVTLKLDPKDGAGESYLAEIIKPSYVLGALTTESADSRVRIEFSDTKTGVTLEDSEFVYQPKKTDTIHQN